MSKMRPKILLRVSGITKDRISGSNHYGISCQFVKIDENWGAKCYSSAWYRDHNWNRQRQAAAHGLGPKVGPRFKYGGYYCYLTEVVEVLWDMDAAENMDREQNEENDWISERDRIFDELEAEHMPEILELTEKMEAVGIDFRDNHLANVGRNRNGQLVCIDFGED